MELRKEIADIIPIGNKDNPIRLSVADAIIALLPDSNKCEGNEIEHLKALCKELLEGAHKCTEEPHYIIQPFLDIVKRHLIPQGS